MREVFEVGNGGGTESKMRMSATPGYLELSEEKLTRLVSKQPIEELYEVEEQPFARGKYAAVRLCRHRQTGQRFAAKFLRKRRRSTDLRPEILHEVAILDACASSPRIVRLHHVFESAHEMILLLELAPGGELQMLLDRDEVPEERQVKRLMRQILDGLVYLHSINVAHLDIKPQNLVLTDEFPQGEVKLCDLGISRHISDGADIRDILGTPDYVAPEVLNYEPISLATDMWSVGVLLYVLLTGCSPFGGDTKQETFCNISQCNLDFPEDLFEDVSEDVKDLMRKLMVKEPSNRLSAVQCLQHRWFTVVEPTSKLSVAVVPVAFNKTTESVQPKTEEVRAKRSPVAVRKPESEVSESIVVHEKILTRSVTIKNTAAPSITTSPRENSLACSKTISETATAFTSVEKSLVEKHDVETNFNERGSSGMKSFRKNNFMKNMGSIVERVTAIAATDMECNNNILDNVVVKPAPRTTAGLKTPMPETPAANTNASYFTSRPINKATAMQTMPVNSINGYKFDRPCQAAVMNVQQQNVNTSRSDSVRRRVLDNKDCVYQFRKCYILDDSEDDTTVAPAPNSLSIDGTNDSETSSGYFDYSSSCSSSDSVSDVSESSVDSSADRLSTASIEDSLEYDYSKNDRHQYLGTTVPSYGIRNRNVWQMGTVTLGNKPRQERTIYSGTNQSYISAYDRFNSMPGEYKKLSLPSKVSSQEIVFATARKQAAKAAHTSVINKVTTASLLHTTVMNKIAVASLHLPNIKCTPPNKEIGINIERERSGNQVVLREVKGGKCSRFNEVKCESVQSRIRKFQM